MYLLNKDSTLEINPPTSNKKGKVEEDYSKRIHELINPELQKTRLTEQVVSASSGGAFV